MINIGVTLSARTKSEIANLGLDFIEVKNLELEFLKSTIGIADKSSLKSMHVQYLPSPEQKATTLNLASKETLEIINDEDSDLYQAYRFLKPSIISFHLCFSSEEVGTEGVDNHNFAIGRVLSREETFERISTSLLAISDRFKKIGYKGKILIENLDYHPTGAYEHICEPSFISKIAEHMGCLILLDVAHTIISSHYLGIRVIDFVKGIGMDSIYEVHVNSPLYEDGEWYDINRPFYRLAEAENLVQFIAEEKTRSGQNLLLNIECDEEIQQQLRRLQNLKMSGGRTHGGLS